MMSGLDLHLFQVINKDLSNAVFDVLMPFVTDPGHFVIPLTLVGIGLSVWGGGKGRLVVVMALLLLVVSNAASEAIKSVFERPRPCLAVEAVRLLVGCSQGSFSFPSSHASNITAQALFFAGSYRPLAVPLFVVAGAVGYSRVYVGVHYPVDVVGGALVGLACGALFILLKRAVEQHLPSSVRSPKTSASSVESSDVRGPEPKA
jgi:undecaprenyl-diphosphatase